MSDKMNLTATEMFLNEVAVMAANMKVAVPSRKLNNIEIAPLEITEEMLEPKLLTDGIRCYTPPGIYTQLMIDGDLWMSDTLAERLDHLSFIRKVIREQSETVLITGLGLGMVVAGLIKNAPCVKKITVIEQNTDILNMVHPTYRDLAKENGVEFVAYGFDAWKFPDYFNWDGVGNLPQYDAIWHDIWIDAGEHLEEEYEDIRRAYELFAPDFQMCWGEEFMQDPDSYEQIILTMFGIMAHGIVIDGEVVKEKDES
ncbi:methyltransferase [Gordonia phage Jumbo]|uniref:Methyltransferase n=1 Tax=Gordonia phage Jumbo TaxID=1887650 RepID=A0A1B3B0S0_9CAUD|nr:methyltransferase [Gordonia phage Jumbo]AOE44589.1 methyltransferase [Gordonia phage Jumbo]